MQLPDAYQHFVDSIKNVSDERLERAVRMTEVGVEDQPDIMAVRGAALAEMERRRSQL